MRRKIAIVLSCAIVLAFCFAMFVLAEDLPIDITAIGRQEARDGQIATRVGANLFTADAQVVNNALAEQVRRRQTSAQYLFASVPVNYVTEPTVQIMNAASGLALFSQPSNIGSISISHQNANQPISIWLIISLIAVCALGGFAWALIARAKKKGQRESVH